MIGDSLDEIFGAHVGIEEEEENGGREREREWKNITNKAEKKIVPPSERSCREIIINVWVQKKTVNGRAEGEKERDEEEKKEKSLVVFRRLRNIFYLDKIKKKCVFSCFGN